MYPYSLLSNQLTLNPLFWDQTMGLPAILDYSTTEFECIDPTHQGAIDLYNQTLLDTTQRSWALGWYLEDRSHILTGTHIRAEGRIYHLGVDVLLPAGTILYSPLDGIVYERWYESWDGNYGWYVIIRYTLDGADFFALYGHLSYDSITLEEHIWSGEAFAALGQQDENGNWFEHLHLQVFTGKDLDLWKSRWYCSLSDLPYIREYCPDPSFLLRY